MWTPGNAPNDQVQIVPFDGRKWVLDGGAWVPEGVKVIDAKANMMVPSQFEPQDFAELANPRDVINARNRKKGDRSWKLKNEIDAEEPIAISDIPDPVPLTPAVIAELQQDPDALVTQVEPRKKRGRPPLHA